MQGYAPAVWPIISVSPWDIDFGTVAINLSSDNRTVTITNTGTANLTIGTITIVGLDPGEFEITEDNASGQELEPTQSATLKVQFKPTSAGGKYAQLRIPSDDPYTWDYPYVYVTMQGDAPAVWPIISVDPWDIDFGTVAINLSSDNRTVTITNTGTANLTIGTITIVGWDPGEFDIVEDNASGQELIPGQSANLTVQFKPTSAGLIFSAHTIPSKIYYPIRHPDV